MSTEVKIVPVAQLLLIFFICHPRNSKFSADSFELKATLYNIGLSRRAVTSQLSYCPTFVRTPTHTMLEGASQPGTVTVPSNRLECTALATTESSAAIHEFILLLFNLFMSPVAIGCKQLEE